MTNSTPTAPGPHSEPDDREEIYFDGSPPIRAHWAKLLLAYLASLLLILVAAILIDKRKGPLPVPMLMIMIALILPGLPMILVRSVRYRISNYRIDFERGLLAKNIDTMELWHVEDLHFHQSLLERIMGVGTITVLSKDDSMPTLELFGLPNPRPLYETLKQRVIAVKRQRGVIKTDPG
jgi:hypothetical protein